MIFQGTKANYIVAQASFIDGADDFEDEEEEEETPEEDEEEKDEDDEDKEDALPVSTWKPPMTIPTEERGTGSNKYTFFVCNQVKKALESRTWRQ